MHVFACVCMYACTVCAHGCVFWYVYVLFLLFKCVGCVYIMNVCTCVVYVCLYMCLYVFMFQSVWFMCVSMYYVCVVCVNVCVCMVVVCVYLCGCVCVHGCSMCAFVYSIMVCGMFI